MQNKLKYIAPRLKDKERIETIKSEAPVLRYLIDYGKAKQLQQLNKIDPDFKNISRDNVFRHLLNQYKSQTAQKSSKKNCSFLHYKNTNNYHALFPPVNSPKDQKINGKRIKTMPSQLTALKGQLLQLPCLKATNRRKSKITQNNFSMVDSLDNEEVNYTQNGSIQLGISQAKYQQKGNSYKSNKIRYQQKIKQILAAAEENKVNKTKNINNFLEKSRLFEDNSIGKLQRLMSLREPPSQTLLGFLDKVQLFQLNQEKQLAREVMNSQKSNNIHKVEVLLQYQRDLHKKNMKQFLQIKKNFKIELSKLNQRKRSQNNASDKVDKVIESMVVRSIESEIKKQGKNINCPICL